MKLLKDYEVPIDWLRETVCEEFAISVDELDSTFKYGTIPLARYTLCYILKEIGLRNIEIAKLTGYFPSRVYINISSSIEHQGKDWYYREIVDRLLKKYKDYEEKTDTTKTEAKASDSI